MQELKQHSWTWTGDDPAVALTVWLDSGMESPAYRWAIDVGGTRFACKNPCDSPEDAEKRGREVLDQLEGMFGAKDVSITRL